MFQSLLITKNNQTLKDCKSIRSNVRCSNWDVLNHLLTIAFLPPLKTEHNETAVSKVLTLNYKEQCFTVKYEDQAFKNDTKKQNKAKMNKKQNTLLLT